MKRAPTEAKRAGKPFPAQPAEINWRQMKMAAFCFRQGTGGGKQSGRLTDEREEREREKTE